jgi:acetyl-CoA carboxylase biotin carboxyl carrier protein
MESKDIRELATLMNEMGLTALEYSGAGVTLKLRRAHGAMHTAGDMPARATEQPEEQREEPGTAGGFTVKSPMVGVFYSAPGADKEPYVEVGATVHAGDVLCIIEAMKIMNEITAERDGVIAEVCAENKQVVEFNQPLFRITPGV